MSKLNKNNQGSVLLITLLIMSSIMTVAFAASAVIMNNIYMSRTQIDSNKALNAAETGADRILLGAKTGLFTKDNCDETNSKYIFFSANSSECTSDINLAKVFLPSNQAYYYVVYNDANSFKSFGLSISGVRRAIEISFVESVGVCATTFCTGTPPENSTLCVDDDTGLDEAAPIVLVDPCTELTKCEYICNPGYEKNGEVCVSTTNNCVGVTPAYSSICLGDDTELTSNISKTLVSACTSLTKCEYVCSQGTIVGGGCLPTTAYFATGGTITSANGYQIHTFTSSGTFTPSRDYMVDVLVVAGGGGGGMDMGGGGGGGGVIYYTNLLVTGGVAMPVVVGLGGDGAPAAGASGQPTAHQYTIPAKSGGNSSFGGLVAIGGGFGGSSYYAYTPGIAGGSGGSGGGASGYNPNAGSFSGGQGTLGQGNRGGNSTMQYYSGGGGGAGGQGTDSPSVANGGPGVLNAILGTSYYWGGGGAGAGHSTSGGAGGIGGGGGAPGYTTIGGAGGAGLNNGVGNITGYGNAPGAPGGNGGANTGGGGGGGTHYNSNNKGGNGGSGIVIIRYIPIIEGQTADLTSLVLSDLPSNYTFSGGTYSYNGITVASAVSSITVTPTGVGTILVNGTIVISGNASGGISLIGGEETTITIVVTENGKAPVIYTIKVTRQASCTGTPPANSTLCYGDDVSLIADKARVLVSACGLPKCEYICNFAYGYVYSGGSCVLQ